MIEMKKKEMIHKKSKLFDNVVRLPPSQMQYRRYMIKHAGKNNHTVSGTFSVKQEEGNVPSRIHFCIFTEAEILEWFFYNIHINNNNLFFQDKNKFIYHIEKQSGKFQFPIKDDEIIYVRMDNYYLLTIPKNISLNIMEEWDEEKSVSDVAITIPPSKVATTIPPSDIVTTIPPSDESLKDTIEDMIKDSQESLMIISPYMDMTLISNLIEKKKQGVKIEIILRDDKQIKGLSKDGMNQVRKSFPQSHRLHHSVHSRLFIRDAVETLISSADLTQQSLQNQVNLGIKTSDPKIVEECKVFFQKVWQESEGVKSRN